MVCLNMPVGFTKIIPKKTVGKSIGLSGTFVAHAMRVSSNCSRPITRGSDTSPCVFPSRILMELLLRPSLPRIGVASQCNEIEPLERLGGRSLLVQLQSG